MLLVIYEQSAYSYLVQIICNISHLVTYNNDNKKLFKAGFKCQCNVIIYYCINVSMY